MTGARWLPEPANRDTAGATTPHRSKGVFAWLRPCARPLRLDVLRAISFTTETPRCNAKRWPPITVGRNIAICVMIGLQPRGTLKGVEQRTKEWE
jgi:hypothetical protein